MATAPLLLAGCLDNPGVDPPEGELNFPIALALAPPEPTPDGGGRQAPRLYVANANFDLRYNAGSVQAYNLEKLIQCNSECKARDECVILPESVPRPPEDSPIQAKKCPGVLSSEVWTGSFASDMAVSPDGDRVYVTIRSEANLTFVDVKETGKLACGGTPGEVHRCTDTFERGDEAIANERDLDLPSDPVGLHVGPLSDLVTGEMAPPGDYVLAAHRGNRASLFLDRPMEKPSLVDVQGGFPDRLSNIRFEPRSGLAWMTSASAARVARVGVAFDTGQPQRSRLFAAGSLGIGGLVSGGGANSRAVEFDPREDVARGYVLSRSPEALLVVDLDESGPGRLAIDDVIDVCGGPSKLDVRELTFDTDTGRMQRVLGFVSCFDSRALYIIDLEQGLLLGAVRGVSGPFDLAVDTTRDTARLYIGDFRASVLRVVDLSPVRRCLQGADTTCSPRVVGIVGRPRPVEELR